LLKSEFNHGFGACNISYFPLHPGTIHQWRRQLYAIGTIRWTSSFAGWLLLSLDRLPTNELIMTQELIADMLGVRREGVTKAAGKLQSAGLIHCSHGRIRILDRPGLEARVCECYAVVKKESARLLPDVSVP